MIPKMLDRDHDDHFNGTELHFAMTNLGEKLMDTDVVGMICEVDIVGNGHIKHEELIKMIEERCSVRCVTEHEELPCRR